MTMLPLDSDGNAIPALRLRSGGAHAVPATATSARNSTPFAPETRVVTLYATGPVFLRTGDAAVMASGTDHYLPGGFHLAVSLGGGKRPRHSHVAVVRAEGDCTLYVSEME